MGDIKAKEFPPQPFALGAFYFRTWQGTLWWTKVCIGSFHAKFEAVKIQIFLTVTLYSAESSPLSVHYPNQPPNLHCNCRLGKWLPVCHVNNRRRRKRIERWLNVGRHLSLGAAQIRDIHYSGWQSSSVKQGRPVGEKHGRNLGRHNDIITVVSFLIDYIRATSA